jgi:hypothetical protein
VNTWKFSGPVSAVAWNPSPSHQLLAVVVDDAVIFISTGTGDSDATEVTDALLSAGIQAAVSGGSGIEENNDGNDGDKDETVDSDEDGKNDKKNRKQKHSVAKWRIPAKDPKPTPKQTWMGSSVGPRLEIKLECAVKRIAWHYKGDYLAILSANAETTNVTVHQVLRILQ